MRVCGGICDIAALGASITSPLPMPSRTGASPWYWPDGSNANTRAFGLSITRNGRRVLSPDVVIQLTTSFTGSGAFCSGSTATTGAVAGGGKVGSSGVAGFATGAGAATGVAAFAVAGAAGADTALGLAWIAVAPNAISRPGTIVRSGVCMLVSGSRRVVVWARSYDNSTRGVIDPSRDTAARIQRRAKR